MYATLISSPPLGQTTVISPHKRSVKFTVLIESSSQRPWDVALWSNFEEQDKWTSLNLAPDATPPSVMVLNDHGNRSSNVHRQWFTIDLDGLPKHGSTVSFTITFRSARDEAWKWANEQFSTSDGHIIYQSAEAPKDDLSHYISGLPPYVKIEKERSETPDTLLWSIASPVKAASGKASGFSKNKLGKPTDFLRWFATVRLWSAWVGPRQGRDTFAPDKEAILAAFLRKDGSHLVIVAVSGMDDVLTLLRHDDNGNVVIDSRNDREKEGTARLIASVGPSLESALAAAMYHARKLVTEYQIASGEMAAEEKALMKDYKPEWLENWYEGLAYCTWNGVGKDLTEKKIVNALDTLKKNDINIQNLIIDDNWQSLSGGEDQFKDAWIEFEANKEGFPRGLKAAITDVRKNHPYIKHIAVWHALFGYWGGIAASGKIAKEYKTTVTRKKGGVSGYDQLAVAKEDVPRFYHDFYQFLSSAGIDSVKTDAQFYVDELDSADDRRDLIQTYQDAWNTNHLRFFYGKAISCMSHAPQILFHSLLPTNKPRILWRNSDDFFPDVPASHPWHVFCNAHNAIFSQHLNILPDWDMFQTGHDFAAFHAAARCVSGGPIYITDTPGKHDIDLITQMTGNTSRGDTVILRSGTVGRSAHAYNSYDDAVLLKISTYTGAAGTGVSILGVFNCTQHPIKELIGLYQFPGAEKGTYIIRNHTTGQTSDPTSVQGDNALVHLELPVQGWEILSAFPLHAFKLDRQHHADGPADISVANLGMLGKMSGAAAIVNTDCYIERSSGRLRVWTSLKILGTYGIYISDLKKRNIKNDLMGVIFGRPIPAHCVKISDTNDNVLEIDTVRAWKETDSNAGWSNEVAVELLIR